MMPYSSSFVVGSVDEDFQNTNLLLIFSFTEENNGDSNAATDESAFACELKLLPIKNPAAKIVKINEPIVILLIANLLVKCFGINVLFL